MMNESWAPRSTTKRLDHRRLYTRKLNESSEHDENDVLPERPLRTNSLGAGLLSTVYSPQTIHSGQFVASLVHNVSQNVSVVSDDDEDESDESSSSSDSSSSSSSNSNSSNSDPPRPDTSSDSLEYIFQDEDSSESSTIKPTKTVRFDDSLDWERFHRHRAHLVAQHLLGRRDDRPSDPPTTPSFRVSNIALSAVPDTPPHGGGVQSNRVDWEAWHQAQRVRVRATSLTARTFPGLDEPRTTSETIVQELGIPDEGPRLLTQLRGRAGRVDLSETLADDSLPWLHVAGSLYVPHYEDFVVRGVQSLARFLRAYAGGGTTRK